jgi:NDP-sugar pyrophosphorylase family protein
MNGTSVMLLAAGRGTRLGPIGLSLPKALVPICGYPAIRYGLAACVRAGLSRVVINVHHLGDQVRGTLGDGGGAGIAIDYSIEPDLLGTGGGIANARRLLGDGRVLIMNAKVVADLDLKAILRGHMDSSAAGTLLLREDPDPGRWGAIQVDSTGRVVGILAARSPHPAIGPVVERMFTGVHIMEPALLDRLRAVPCDVIRDAYMPALEAGAYISAQLLEGYFAEHSTPSRYLAGNLDLLRDPALIPHPPGPLTGAAASARTGGATLHPPYRIDAGATIEPGAVVGPEVVIGAGAHVRGGARIRRGVVWPDAVVDHDTEQAVVTPSGTFPVA